MKRCLIFIFYFSLFWIVKLPGQILINELGSINTGQVTDEDNDNPDWFEIINFGPFDVNLYKYQLSDGLSSKNKWILPSINLSPGETRLIFASGKNRPASPDIKVEPIINHWETAVYDANTWEYIIASSTIGSNWVDPSFNTSNWLIGQGGIGYGDNDDTTLVPDGTISIYARTTFKVTDKSILTAAIFNMDYDDGFVAYLNGVEIARTGLTGMPPGWDELAIDHEAQLYSGGSPTQYKLDIKFIQSLLVIGTNVLAVEVHNSDKTSNDLTMRPFLHFAIKNTTSEYGPNPAWFDPMTANNTGELHTNFKLKANEVLVLRDSFGIIKDSVTVKPLLPGDVQARIPDGANWCTTDNTTPGESNNAAICYNGYAHTPIIDLPSGFYIGPQTININGTTIKYTLDGTIPDSTSADYTSPINITKSKVLRARAFESGKLPSTVANASYFINEATQLPVVSITAVHGDLFIDGSGGPAVYDNYALGGKAPCHVSYFDKDKQLKFEENASIKVVGNFSKIFKQKSLEFDFSNKYGALADVPNEIFKEEKPGINKLHGFRIRNMDDDAPYTRMRDPIANRISLNTHADATASKNVAVFINGIYWGHYCARELLDQYYVRDNYKANADSVDIIKTSYNKGTVAINGSKDNFDAMRDYINTHDLSDSIYFNQVNNMIDIENWADYWATEIFLANGDWYSSVFYNNTECFKSYAPDLKWKFVLWDMAYSQGIGFTESTPQYNSLNIALANPVKPNIYTPLFNSLLKNTAFKTYFINRFADLMNYNWTYKRAVDIIDANVNSMATEIMPNYERWIPTCQSYCPVNYDKWLLEVQKLKDFYLQRPTYQRQHINALFNLNGNVNISLDVTPKGAGFIKISTIIPDSLPWTGIYFNGNPVSLTAFPNQGYTFSNWSPNNYISDSNAISFTNNIDQNTSFTANFNGSPQDLSLTISEINYNSDPTRNSGNWFELHNFGNDARDISGYTVSFLHNVLNYQLPPNTIIPPNDYLVIVDDIDKFHSQFPTINNVVGPSGMKLSNKSDTIYLKNITGDVVLTAGYSDKTSWPQCADGYGRTLENAYEQDLNYLTLPEGWFNGCMGGSPGKAYSPCIEDVVFNEINYHSPLNKDAGDWVELINASSQAIDLSNWRFRDSQNDTSFVIPQGTLISPDSFLVIYSNWDLFNSIHPGVNNLIGPFPFGLSSKGEIIRLYDQNDKLYLSMFYNNTNPWPIEPDGSGPTLELILLGTDLNKGIDWKASCAYGTPGRPNTDCPTSVQELNDESITITPNPSKGWFNLKLTDHNISQFLITTVNGVMILSNQNCTDKHEWQIDLSNQLPGIYILQLINPKGCIVRKLVRL